MKHFKNIQNLSEFYDIDINHPLINIIKYEDTNNDVIIKNEPIKFGFYQISFVKNFNGYIEINNNRYTGQNGVLHFIEPGQIYTCNSTNPWKGFQILIHPDIFNFYFTHKSLNKYDFFSYQVNETLLLIKEEEIIVNNLLEIAWEEYNKNKDHFSIPIILSTLNTLFNFAERFYSRQFESRKVLSNQLTKKFKDLLKTYYVDESNTSQPNVQYFANKLNITPNYLSDTIKHNTGQSALNTIHEFIIDEAKSLLINTDKTVSEISYELGFDYPNYFSKLFKNKVKLSPSQFRTSVKSI